MAKIYIGASYPKKFKIGAYAIAKWSSVNYSHVFIRFESDTMPGTVYHAAHGMVHFRSTDNFLKENDIIKEFYINVTDDVRKQILIECVNLAGEKYGYLELVKIFVTDIADSLNIKLCTKNSKGYICSELVGKIIVEKLGYTFDKPLFLLKPVDIVETLEVKHG